MTTLASSSLSPSAETPEPPPPWLCIQLTEEIAAGKSAKEVVPPGLRRVWPCLAGQTIAIVVPGDKVPGSSGRPSALPLDAVQLGANVAWNPTHTGIAARKSGHILLDHNTISVSETLELSDDLDASAGAIDFPGPVNLRKNVLDLVHLSAVGDITINGSVEAATLHSHGNVVVHHGICGKNHGEVVAAGDVKARFASNARIIAREVHIGHEVANSRIICRGLFKGNSVLSGHVIAQTGICCDTAGSETGIRVILEIGFPPDELQQIRHATSEISNLQRKAQQIHSVVEPLMRNPKLLTAQQKEKATELLFQASEFDARASEITTLTGNHRRRLAAMLTSPIEIRGKLNPGVIIRIAGLESDIRTPLRGPLKIQKSEESGICQLIVFDYHGNKLAALPVGTTEDGAFLKRLAGIA